MNNNDIGTALIRTASQNTNPDLPMAPIPIRPRARATNCCPTYRRLQTVNALILTVSGISIGWYVIDLFVNHFDRKESNYLGIATDGFYFLLGLYACRYSYQMQKKALAEEARTLVEIDDDEEQVQTSVAGSKVNVFPARPSSSVSDNKNNNTSSSRSTIDMNIV